MSDLPGAHYVSSDDRKYECMGLRLSLAEITTIAKWMRRHSLATDFKDRLPYVSIESEANAAYVYMDPSLSIVKTVDLGDGLQIDLDGEDRVLGIEIL